MPSPTGTGPSSSPPGAGIRACTPSTANGGTDDVSVIDLERALAGDRLAEIHRIPTQIGPWGIAASPDAQGRRQRRGSAGARRRGRRYRPDRADPAVHPVLHSERGGDRGPEF